MATYQVKTEQFEGPFDVLLSLIEKKKMHISEVSIASIADDYISFVRENEFRLPEVSSFIVVAATLAYMKSKALLPTFTLGEEEQDAQELEERLRLFAIFTDAAKVLGSTIFTKTLYPRIFRVPKKEIVFTPDAEQMNTNELMLHMHELLNRSPQDSFVPEKKVEKQMSLKEVLENITTKITRFVRAQFSELTVGSDKKDTAISFLAVLELYKQGFVDLSQNELFGSIMVEKNTVETPNYRARENEG